MGVDGFDNDYVVGLLSSFYLGGIKKSANGNSDERQIPCDRRRIGGWWTHLSGPVHEPAAVKVKPEQGPPVRDVGGKPVRGTGGDSSGHG
jgi:hypothetical protein